MKGKEERLKQKAKEIKNTVTEAKRGAAQLLTNGRAARLLGQPNSRRDQKVKEEVKEKHQCKKILLITNRFFQSKSMCKVFKCKQV